MGLLDRFTDNSQADDEARLEELCSQVEIGVRQFDRVGSALKEIRDKQLYRRQAKTFEDFCQVRWSMTPQHAGRLIAAAELCHELGTLGQHIKTENDARMIRLLPEEDRVAVIEESIVTGEAVSTVARKRKPRGSKSRKPIRFRLPGGTLIIEPNKRFSTVEAMIEELLTRLEKRNAA